MNRGMRQQWGFSLGLMVLAIPSALASPLQRRIAAEPERSIDVPLLAESFSLAQAEERKAEADRLLEQGFQFLQTSQFQEALDNFQEALVIYRELGDRIPEGVTLVGLGKVYNNLGQYPQAIEFYQQALAIAREVSDRSGEGTTLNNLGNVYNGLGEYPQAIDFYQQALTIYQEIGNRSGEGE